MDSRHKPDSRKILPFLRSVFKREASPRETSQSTPLIEADKPHSEAKQRTLHKDLDSAAVGVWDTMETQAEKIRTGEIKSSLTSSERNRFADLVREMRRLTWEAYDIYAPYCPQGQAAELSAEVLNKIPKEEVERLSVILEQEGHLRKEFGELTDRARSRK